MGTSRFLFLLTASLCFCTVALAQEKQDKINTDRPDQTEGTHVIKPGEFQIESDVYVNKVEENRTALITSSLIRFGVLHFAEFRCFVEEGKYRDEFIETTQGVYPLAAGTKIELLKDHEWLPNISMVGYLQLPFTTRTSENKLYWSPTAIMAFEYKIGKVSIDVNGALKGNSFNPKFNWLASSSLRYNISKDIQAFVEYFGQYGTMIHPSHNVDGGMMYHLRPNLQLNASIGSSVFSEESNMFVMFGGAIRLPK